MGVYSCRGTLQVVVSSVLRVFVIGKLGIQTAHHSMPPLDPVHSNESRCAYTLYKGLFPVRDTEL